MAYKPIVQISCNLPYLNMDNILQCTHIKIRYLQILLITSYISHDFRLQAVDIILLHQKEEAFEPMYNQFSQVLLRKDVVFSGIPSQVLPGNNMHYNLLLFSRKSFTCVYDPPTTISLHQIEEQKETDTKIYEASSPFMLLTSNP